MNTITLKSNKLKLPDSIRAYKTFGVNRSLVSYLCINHFNYPELYKDTLSNYYLLYWKPDYFFSQLNHGEIIHQDTIYIVVYKNCTPAALKKESQIRLSFRKPQAEFNIPAYVLVTAN